MPVRPSSWRRAGPSTPFRSIAGCGSYSKSRSPARATVEANVWSNLERLKPTDDVKVLVCDRSDFDRAAELIRARRLVERCPVLFSAVFGQVDPTELAAWILESRLPVRLQLQQHKILWDPNARGV
jgi:7-carboxy-7-deazaguanine synthase